MKQGWKKKKGVSSLKFARCSDVQERTSARAVVAMLLKEGDEELHCKEEEYKQKVHLGQTETSK